MCPAMVCYIGVMTVFEAVGFNYIAATGFFTELSKTIEERGLSSLGSVQQLYNHHYGHYTSTDTVIPGVVDRCMHVDTISPLFKFNFSLSRILYTL